MQRNMTQPSKEQKSLWGGFHDGVMQSPRQDRKRHTPVSPRLWQQKHRGHKTETRGWLRTDGGSAGGGGDWEYRGSWDEKAEL